MSTIMMSIVWLILGLISNLIMTSFNSPITLTFVMSNWMIWIELFRGVALSFSYIEKVMTFENPQKSTRKLWKFWFKISDDRGKGTVYDFDFFHVKEVFMWEFWLALSVIMEGFGMELVALNYLNSLYSNFLKNLIATSSTNKFFTILWEKYWLSFF